MLPSNSVAREWGRYVAAFIIHWIFRYRRVSDPRARKMPLFTRYR
jgi:hypothetical protein